MTSNAPEGCLSILVRELSGLQHETEWVEFKESNADSQAIGESISALANSAALLGKPFAYIVWGVRDNDRGIVGTTFRPRMARVGNEEIENWLLRLLDPAVDFRFSTLEVDGHAVVLLEIPPATTKPVRFSGQEFIRVGSYTKKLKDFSEKERALWKVFDQRPFEDGVAYERAAADDVLRWIDYPAYFELLEQPLPENRDGILSALAADRLICPSIAGTWDIANLGAILFAKHFDYFRTLRRKAVRVVQYRGAGRVETVREQEGTKGYACGFEGLIGFINGLLPSNEVIQQALRKTVPMFPELAVRELVANALIHQDFHVTGAGPMVEIFDDRIEITNPGEPLVDTDRFLDTPPRSRNEALASLMRRFRICEERGSGIDKVVFQVEFFQLPAPLFEKPNGSTRAVLFAHKRVSAMDETDRTRACYLHACLKYVTRGFLTNASLRQRFGIAEKNKAIASRYIREAVTAKVIKPFDEGAARKMMKYVPFWA